MTVNSRELTTDIDSVPSQTHLTARWGDSNRHLPVIHNNSNTQTLSYQTVSLFMCLQINNPHSFSSDKTTEKQIKLTAAADKNQTSLHLKKTLKSAPHFPLNTNASGEKSLKRTFTSVHVGTSGFIFISSGVKDTE